MNKRNAMIIVSGVLLTALLIALGLAVSAISKKKEEINSLSQDIKNKDTKLSQLEKQVEGLNTEKNSLAGLKASLEDKLVKLEEMRLVKGLY